MNKVQTSEPINPSTSIQLLGTAQLPDLLPPIGENESASVSTPAVWETSIKREPCEVDACKPCEHLSQDTIDKVLKTIDESITRAKAALVAHAEHSHVQHAENNLIHLTEANRFLVALNSWLQSHKFFTPFVSNATAAYTIHSYMRAVIYQLHYARHHSMVMAVWANADPETINDLESFEATTKGINLAEVLGEQAGRCYLRGYFAS